MPSALYYIRYSVFLRSVRSRCRWVQLLHLLPRCDPWRERFPVSPALPYIRCNAFLRFYRSWCRWLQRLHLLPLCDPVLGCAPALARSVHRPCISFPRYNHLLYRYMAHMPVSVQCYFYYGLFSGSPLVLRALHCRTDTPFRLSNRALHR